MNGTREDAISRINLETIAFLRDRAAEDDCLNIGSNSSLRNALMSNRIGYQGAKADFVDYVHKSYGIPVEILLKEEDKLDRGEVLIREFSTFIYDSSHPVGVVA
ncbi:MAG: hypothetical protein AABW79_01220 [Nanoarchaeota archaeon]